MGKVLKINTADSKQISVEFNTDGKKDKLVEDSTRLKSEAALPAIDKLLSRNNAKIEKITEVEVNKGPGSFTGIRVGVAIANALSFLLKISVNGKKVGELEEAVYNK
jgi:tRNA threonylcarbamoyladenosine biosynthesis protein TsaB